MWWIHLHEPCRHPEQDRPHCANGELARLCCKGLTCLPRISTSSLLSLGVPSVPRGGRHWGDDMSPCCSC